MHILVVDDHPDIRELVGRIFANEGYEVSTAADGASMWEVLDGADIDLVVLDLMLPGTDGLTLCREIRATRPALPVIMLTAKSEEIDKVVGLKVGADDYIVKPFAGRELVARVRAVIRRARQGGTPVRPPSNTVFRFRGWRLVTASRELESDDGVVVPLSTSEFDLLLAFVLHPQTVLSRERLLDLTKGREATPFDRSVDTHVSHLRRKLGDPAGDPEIIKTVWGGGYLFSPGVTRE
ncbi:MAG: response regulator [Rhodospirillales bacterium]